MAPLQPQRRCGEENGPLLRMAEADKLPGVRLENANASVAQGIELVCPTHRVAGSIPAGGTLLR